MTDASWRLPPPASPLRPASKQLGDLVELAELLLAKPHAVIGSSERMARLREEVARELACPRDGARLVGEEAAMLVTALHAMTRSFADRPRATRWAMIAGCLLPIVRADRAAAHDAELHPPAAADAGRQP